MSANVNFNTEGRPFQRAVPVQEIRRQLLGRLPSVLQYLLPNGRVHSHVFQVGDIEGTKGESLKIEMQGPKAGMWQDFATNEGGDIFDLWARKKDFNTGSDFPKLMEDIQNWLGIYVPFQASINTASISNLAANDDLGAYTAKWDYTDQDGKVTATVFRYDPKGKSKEFRPYDAIKKLSKAPSPRPLYNLPGIAASERVILAEGEKSAQALIDQGVCATTAMFGAKATLDKTDWSPLKDKHVIIWPDNDEPGKAYAQSAYQLLVEKGVRSVKIIEIPADKPEKWDAADAIAEGLDAEEFISKSAKTTARSRKRTPILKAKQYFNDNEPIAEDIVSPRIITPHGLAVFGGAPKVGKTDFLISWMAHMAAGIPFLGMTPARPLKIFYLQAEIEHDYLKERLKNIIIDESYRELIGENLSLTPKVNLTLNEKGVEEIVEDVRDHFQGDLVDIIVIDPLRNVFEHNGSDSSENDNVHMMSFLKNRLEYMRDQINPKAGIMVAHHTRKITKTTFEEDPFQALAGASSLRGYFTSGIMLFCPNEEQTSRKLIFEIRNGPKIPTKVVDKIDGKWQELDHSSTRLVHQDYGKKLDAERERRHDVILDIIDAQASKGRVFTMQQFCEAFENKKGLGGVKSIRARLDVLSTNGYIKFIKNAENYALKSPSGTKFGYLCVENMHLKTIQGEVMAYPSHYKCRETGAALEVENPKIWVYMDEQ